jgi:hypothetical protein
VIHAISKCLALITVSATKTAWDGCRVGCLPFGEDLLDKFPVGNFGFANFLFDFELFARQAISLSKLFFATKPSSFRDLVANW